MTRDHAAAHLLSQVIYWSDRTSDPDGWIHKTQLVFELHREGRVVEKSGVSPVAHYRINDERLRACVDEFLERKARQAGRVTEKQQLDLRDTNSSDSGKSANRVAEKQQAAWRESSKPRDRKAATPPYSETTPEITTTESPPTPHAPRSPMTRERVGDASVVVAASRRKREGEDSGGDGQEDRRSGGDRRDPLTREDVDTALVNALVDAGLGRSDALGLARLRPEECRRQLELLPYVTKFRTSRGAYLHSAIMKGYGPPPGFEEAQKQQQEAQRRERAATQAQAEGHKRERRDAQETEAAERVLSDPAARVEIHEEAQRRMPPPLRGKPDHVAYQSTFNGLVKRIALEREAADASRTV